MSYSCPECRAAIDGETNAGHNPKCAWDDLAQQSTPRLQLDGTPWERSARFSGDAYEFKATFKYELPAGAKRYRHEDVYVAVEAGHIEVSIELDDEARSTDACLEFTLLAEILRLRGYTVTAP